MDVIDKQSKTVIHIHNGWDGEAHSERYILIMLLRRMQKWQHMFIDKIFMKNIAWNYKLRRIITC